MLRRCVHESTVSIGEVGQVIPSISCRLGRSVVGVPAGCVCTVGLRVGRGLPVHPCLSPRRLSSGRVEDPVDLARLGEAADGGARAPAHGPAHRPDLPQTEGGVIALREHAGARARHIRNARLVAAGGDGRDAVGGDGWGATDGNGRNIAGREDGDLDGVQGDQLLQLHGHGGAVARQTDERGH
eukprot:CAMPEP_0206165342 /NCGR_PEP_ID=MMETSP1474-20131121/20058_1 /ASSEMBLY_ACC=CAM_ASM_001110 /TAXON_ID=97495 /ORGANISM="Imantonia sp., Strain RCC918" /LENGTH=183 /DNA_ID=CAMNT_0053568671 /DNA_START=224 /DNA_END=772 /DNA_ORIENTATION=+